MANVSSSDAGRTSPDPLSSGQLARSAFALVAPFLSILTLMVIWEVLALSGMFSDFLLPSLGVVFGRVIEDVLSGQFFVKTGLTLYRALIGFSIAAAIAIVIGVAMSRSRVLNWFFDPIVSVGFPMPKVAFLPIFMLWFGAHDLSKILLIAFAAFFAIAANTIAGTQGVTRELIWSAQSLGASERRILWTVVLPAALPQILTGLQIALPITLIVAIVAEMLMGGVGLGGTMIHAQRFADSPGVFAGIVEIGFMGFLVIWGLKILRTRLLSWHQEAAR